MVKKLYQSRFIPVLTAYVAALLILPKQTKEER